MTTRTNADSSDDAAPEEGTAAWAADQARDQLASLVDSPIERLVAIERSDDDDSWTVQLEVVEFRRVPDSTDVLALYAVDLDRDGELTGHRRQKRYIRGQGDD